MLRRLFFIVLTVAVLLPGMLVSCQKEERYAGSLDALEFSCDTMAFDTVFTQMGTTTRQLKVYNRGSEAVRLESVTLATGYGSRFRLNVDGDTSMVAKDVTIAAGDSIFVFVRANIKPNVATEPFLIEDAMVLRSGGNVRRLPLTAYGRNAIYHVPTDTIHYADGTPLIDSTFGKPYAYSVIDCEGWRHDLPHVIVGYAVVDSRQTLHLQAGDELYFYNDAVLWVYDSATLDVQGTEEQPVLFTSVRQDGRYKTLPGQWGYVWLSAGSRDNVIEHARIENAYVGLRVDSCASDRPTLTVSNTQVANHVLAGLLCQTATVAGDNLLVYNCGVATVAMQYGGNYAFSRCTFADYWRYDNRKVGSVFVTNTMEYRGTLYVWPMQARLGDCIIYGSRADGEMYVDLDERGGASLVIEHCLVRGGEWDEDPMFVDPYEGDFHLQPESPAIGIGYQYAESEPPQDLGGSGWRLPLSATAHPTRYKVSK